MAPKQQRLDLGLFSTISKAEREINVQKDFESLTIRLEEDSKMPKKEVFKRPVGRPKKEMQAVLLKPKVEPIKPKVKKEKVRYTNWFSPTLWPPIFAAVKQHRNIQGALHYLRATHRKPGDLTSVYDTLSRGSMYEWFHSNRDLKDNYKRCVELGNYFAKSKQHCPILADHVELKEEICKVLKKHRAAGQPLCAVCIQPLIKAIVTKREPQLLSNNRNFRVSLAWTRAFIKAELNWSYRASTTAAGKLPNDFKLQGKTMAQRCAYLVKVHNIPPELVVNTNQTWIHLVPTGGARTWERRGSKHVNVHGIEDKRQITVAVSSAATDFVLPFQVIFQGLTARSLPPLNDGKRDCLDSGWNLTFSSNHWSTLDTCKDFVTTILSTYRRTQITLLGLSACQDMIWLIDCWSVHISKEFIGWMKITYPQIHVLYIPANCTSVFQPADVILQRAFKHAFRQQFNKFTSDHITSQLDADQDVKIDFKMSTLKPKICSWLFSAWLHISNKQDMVRIGWKKCELLRSFESTFQKDAMLENMSTSLFKQTEETKAIDFNINNGEEEIDPEDMLEVVMSNSLTKVEKLCITSTPSVASLREIARKK